MTLPEAYLKHILSFEGGYSDNKVDRGGKTNFGVTQRTYDRWLSDHNKPIRHVKYIEMHEVWSIYDELFWRTAKCSTLPVPLDMVVFDSAVQHGPGRAARWLQGIVGTTQDGDIGLKTLAALNDIVKTYSIGWVVQTYLGVRDEFYEQIMRNDPSQEMFRRGWANRMKRLRTLVKETNV